MLLVPLDPYDLGDPLFLTQLARDLAHRGGGGVLVHGSGEAGERALEATGAVARIHDGVWAVETPEQAAVVERAARELNRRVVHELNEVGVSAVRVAGADRGLLKTDGAGLVAGPVGWVRDLAERGAAVVVASLVAGKGPELREVDALAASAVLARALGTGRVTLFESGSSDAARARASARAERLRAHDPGLDVAFARDLRSAE